MEQLNLVLTLNKNGSITASWSAITNVVRYTAYMSQIGEDHSIYNEKNLLTTSYTSPANLEPNHQYRVIVVAYTDGSSENVSDGKEHRTCRTDNRTCTRYKI